MHLTTEMHPTANSRLCLAGVHSTTPSIQASHASVRMVLQHNLAFTEEQQQRLLQARGRFCRGMSSLMHRVSQMANNQAHSMSADAACTVPGVTQFSASHEAKVNHYAMVSWSAQSHLQVGHATHVSDAKCHASPMLSLTSAWSRLRSSMAV